MEYTTQMDAARKGILTEELKKVAEKEQFDPEKLRELVAQGKAAIPANKNHKCLEPNGIGSMLKTKINVNLGTSRDCKDLDMELAKVNDAVKMGAESIMDLSSWGDTRKFRRKLTAECPAIIGTVPIYDAVVYYHKPLKEITSEEWIKIVEMHAEDGVDFQTIHVGINRQTADRFKRATRLTTLVSRGGSIIFAWMEMTGQENPFYEHFDRILDICQKYDVTLSLGDACRPGCIADATDISQIEELVTLGELTRRAWEKNVQVIIEGPGHMPLNQIAANMQIQRPYHGSHRRRHRGGQRCFLPVLRDPCGASAPSGRGRCEGGNYCLQDRGPCGGYRQGHKGRCGLGSGDEHSQKEAGLGEDVRPLH